MPQASETVGHSSLWRAATDAGEQGDILPDASDESSAEARARIELVAAQAQLSRTPNWLPIDGTATPIRLSQPAAQRRSAEASTHAGELSERDAAANGSRMRNGWCIVLASPRDNDADVSRLCQTLRSCGYAAEGLAPRNREQLTRALSDRGMYVLVVHTDLLDVIALPDLLKVRRQSAAVHWVLAWHTPSPQWAELVVKLQARGCIDCDDSARLQCAIDTVVAGGLWFPRWVANALYFRLLSAVDAARLDVGKQLGNGDSALTPREMQALELMRQGLTNNQIASRLQVSVNTVKKHLKHAFEKRGLRSRRQGLFRSLAAVAGLLAAMSDFLALDFLA